MTEEMVQFHLQSDDEWRGKLSPAPDSSTLVVWK